MHYMTMSRSIRFSRIFIPLVLIFLTLISVNPPRLIGQDKRAEAPTKFVFAVIGDSGTGKREQFAVAEAMDRAHQKQPFDLVVMLGDNIYGGSGSKRMTERFEVPYRSLLSRGVKFQAALGNHDLDGKLNEINYRHFNMQGQRYYTFKYHDDLAQFFALDSTRMSQQQLSWLEKELAASKARWKIAFFHHPLYSSGRRHGADLKLRLALEPMFIRYRVHLVLSGHDHFYERVKPQHGVNYFVSGAAGKLRRGNINRNSPSTAYGNDETCHFMLFEVDKNEIRFHAINPSDLAFDSGIIRRVESSGVADNEN